MLLLPTLAAVTLSLAEDTGASVRSVPEEQRLAYDLATSPSANLTFTWKNSALALAYATRFSLFDVTEHAGYGLNHTAGVNYSWGMRRLRLSASLAGNYGQVLYYNALVAAPPNTPVAPVGTGATPTTMPTIQPRLLPQNSVVTVVGLSAALSAGYQFSRRWSGQLGIGFGVGGGIHGSEETLPLYYGPSAGLGAAYQLTKVDNLGSGLSTALTFIPKSKARFQTITLLETWTHAFAPLTTGSLAAGATFVEARPASHARTTRSVNGAGSASIAQGFKLEGGAQMTASAAATLSTNYDPVLGTVTQSLGGGAGVGWSKKKLSLFAAVNAAHGLPLDSPTSYFSYGASAGTGYQLFKPVSLRASVYWAHQVLPATLQPGTQYPDRWGASVGVTFTAPPIKF